MGKNLINPKQKTPQANEHLTIYPSLGKWEQEESPLSCQGHGPAQPLLDLETVEFLITSKQSTSYNRADDHVMRAISLGV